MAISNGYATLAEFKAWNEIDAATNDADAERAVESASRWIDSFCGRAFWQTPAPVARLFQPCSSKLIELGLYNDLVSVTALATDEGGDGIFETAWAASDYQLLPVHTSSAPEALPYTEILAVAGRRFPSAGAGRVGRVQVTGTWGWPAVPTSVKQACLIQSARLYKRRNSPEGVTGFGSDFGAIRLSARPDPDAVDLIKRYRLRPVLVA